MPLTPRPLSLGRHEVVIVELGNRRRQMFIEVGPQHTRQSPLQADVGSMGPAPQR